MVARASAAALLENRANYPGISIVLAVHNGVALLSRKIHHLLSLDYPNIQEVIIVSDGSTDGTAELLAEYHHPRLDTPSF